MNRLYTLAVGCVLTFWTAALGLAQDPVRMVTAFEQKLAALESKWVDGGNEEYFAEAGSIADWSNERQDSQASVDLLAVLLNKKIEPVAVATADLSAKARAARAVLRDTSAMQSPGREQKVRALATFLGSIRQEAIPDFVARRVTMNVSPPAEAGPRMAGMDPDAIADPVAREKYKAAILENNRNAVLNSRQKMLRNMQLDFTSSIMDFLRRVAHSDEIGLSLVQAAAGTARLTQAERDSLFNSAAQ